jgi:hypothetical protein
MIRQRGHLLFFRQGDDSAGYNPGRFMLEFDGLLYQLDLRNFLARRTKYSHIVPNRWGV